jgi:SAM-dependent methyltransferase
MSDDKRIKDIVKEKYGQVARQVKKEPGCSSSCCGSKKIVEYSFVGEKYDQIEGYVPEADLGLGCGLPTEYADISPGDTVVDLGAGAGNDVFVARSLVGENGRVIGIDMTEDMIEQANANKQKLDLDNVDFRLGEIENLPLEDNSTDVVVSNCVLNLVPDKSKAFAEVYRIIKPGGHFCISDIVLKGELPEKLRKSAEMYAGCVAGAVQQDEYLDIIKKAGFSDVEIKTSKTIHIPDSILRYYLSEDELSAFKENEIGIFSITVVGYKK